MESVETVTIRWQQDFELHDQLNPKKIKIDDGQITSLQKNYKGALYQFTATGLLFPSLVTNHTNQIFITCRKLNRAKIALINGKILNIFGVINLDKINNWVKIKENTSLGKCEFPRAKT